jgi:uncharacterized protein YndB with AHSA1/START domain
MQRDIIQKWFLPHPTETVWEFLTDAELLAQWLMENDFKPVVGHNFKFYTMPRIKFGFDGNVYCEVLEVVPNKRLSYSWKGGPGKGKITLDSVVTWTLTETEKGTELLLEHTGFKGMKNFFAYVFMNKGWAGKIRKRLLERLNGYKK